MTIQVVTAPLWLPVTLAELRSWCRIEADVTDHDNDLTLLAQTMVVYAENLTARAFIERTLRLVLPCWPQIANWHYRGSGIELPQAPLIAVDSVAYVDEDGADQTLAADQYVVHAWHEPGFIVPAWQVTWPNLRAVPNAVQVNYRAGFAPVGSPADEGAHQLGQPKNLKLWLAARVATLFENREQLLTVSNLAALPHHHADGLLDDLVLGERIGG